MIRYVSVCSCKQEFNDLDKRQSVKLATSMYKNANTHINRQRERETEKERKR